MPVPTMNERAIANRRLLRDDVFERLLEAIIDGTLEPGERLRDEDLGSWLGVSRTPIREALTRLVDMGLVDMEPNRYTRVSPLDAQRFLDSFRILATLSRLAADLAMPGLTDAQVVALTNACAEVFRGSSDSPATVQVTALWRFHFLLAEYSHNPTLCRTFNDLGPDVRRVSRHLWTYADQDGLRELIAELTASLAVRNASGVGQAFEVGSVRFAVTMVSAAQAAGAL